MYKLLWNNYRPNTKTILFNMEKKLYEDRNKYAFRDFEPEKANQYDLTELWLKEPFNYVFITILGETDYSYYINKIKVFEKLKRNENMFEKLLDKVHQLLKKICKQGGIDILHNQSVTEFQEAIAEYKIDKFEKKIVESINF
jgi:hypothetical protein